MNFFKLLPALTIPQLRELSEELLPNTHVEVRRQDDPRLDYVSTLTRNIPIILLHRDSEEFGHYILLLPNDKHKTIELFDPFGFKSRQDANTKYFDDTEMNPDKHLEDVLKEIHQVYNWKIIFNKEGVQHPDAHSCGWWCLTRIKYRNMNSDFFKRCMS